MERFYLGFDDAVKSKGLDIDWYFTYYDGFTYLKNLNISSANGNSVEELFLDASRQRPEDYDIIYTHFTALCSPYYKKIHKRYPKAKIIAVDHNPRPIGGFSSIKRLKNILKSFLYSRYINEFIAVSIYSKRHLIKDFTPLIKRKIKIIHNGIDIQKYRKKESFASSHNFIVTSHLRKIKGIQDIINAVHQLPEASKTKVKVTIYGEGDYENALKQLVRTYQLASQIKFKGSTDDLHVKYAEYDYLLHASYGETFCYSVVESLISNVPVITTHKHGNVLELVVEGENGFLFDAGDVTRLSKIINDVVTDQRTISKETMNDSKVSHLSIENMVHGYLNLIDE